MEKLKKLMMTLDEKHLADIMVLDMRLHSALYDFTVITTAKNDRIISGVLRALKDLTAEADFDLKYIEGHHGGEWVLADFGDVVVHVFNQEMRTKYQLEKLWKDAPQVDISQWIQS